MFLIIIVFLSKNADLVCLISSLHKHWSLKKNIHQLTHVLLKKNIRIIDEQFAANVKSNQFIRKFQRFYKEFESKTRL